MLCIQPYASPYSEKVTFLRMQGYTVYKKWDRFENLSIYTWRGAALRMEDVTIYRKGQLWEWKCTQYTGSSFLIIQVYTICKKGNSYENANLCKIQEGDSCENVSVYTNSTVLRITFKYCRKGDSSEITRIYNIRKGDNYENACVYNIQNRKTILISTNRIPTRGQ